MVSFVNQTQATAENLDKHATKLTGYADNIQTLYNQLKQTAKFLTEIVHSLGLDNPQVELLMQKINKLQLEFQETGDLSAQMVDETRRGFTC